MISWPAEVNQTVIDESYSKVYPVNVIKTDIETGPQVYRRRASRLPTMHTITLRLNKTLIVKDDMTEYDVFDEFVHKTLISGIKTTQFPLPMSYTNKEVRFLISSEIYTVTKRIGDYVYVRFTLEEVLS